MAKGSATSAPCKKLHANAVPWVTGGAKRQSRQRHLAHLGISWDERLYMFPRLAGIIRIERLHSLKLHLRRSATWSTMSLIERRAERVLDTGMPGMDSRGIVRAHRKNTRAGSKPSGRLGEPASQRLALDRRSIRTVSRSRLALVLRSPSDRRDRRPPRQAVNTPGWI